MTAHCMTVYGMMTALYDSARHDDRALHDVALHDICIA